MLKITTPATTANIGPGFDTLGMALSLYNVFYFEENEEFKFIDFSAEYANVENNLIAQSYIKTFQIINRNPIPVSIKLEQNIPNSRGLGSSSSCIIAGILAANYYAKANLTKEELIKIAVDIEGHPDNVTPCLVGGLVSSIKESDIYISYDVSKELIFNFIIPNYGLNTETARSVLPKKIPKPDIVFNLSRIVNLPYAFEKGDLNLLKVVLMDMVHEPYRYPLIDGSDDIRLQAHELNLPMFISGAGPTMAILSKENINIEIPNLWEKKILTIDYQGATIEVL